MKKIDAVRAWSIRNMWFPIESNISSISINNGYGIAVSIICFFKETHRYYDAQLLGKLMHPEHTSQCKSTWQTRYKVNNFVFSFVSMQRAIKA